MPLPIVFAMNEYGGFTDLKKGNLIHPMDFIRSSINVIL